MNTPAHAIAWGLLALPWVYPFASGPSPSVEPWLVTLGAAGALLAVLRMDAGVRADMPSVVASAWVWAAVLSALTGLVQYAGVAHHLTPWIPASAPGNAYGALRQRNQFATLTLIGLMSLLPAVGQGARWRYVMPAVLVLVAGNAVSASRTGALGLALLCLAPAVWPSLRNRRVALFLGAAGVGYMLATAAVPAWLAQWHGVQAPTVFDRMAASQGCGSRVVLWSNVVHLVAQKPWLGWGWGELDYAHYASLYPDERFCDILDNAHLLPLHVAVELGIPAAALMTLALTAIVVTNAPWRETGPHRQMAWMILAVILLHSLVEYPLWYGPFCLAAAVSAGLLCQTAGAAMSAHRPAMTDAAILIAAVALMATALFAGWDYWRVSQIYLPYEARSSAYRDDPLSRARQSLLFQDQAGFAELTTTPLTRDNAAHIAALAGRLVHYSPEPRVIKPLVESLTLLGRNDEALIHLARFRAAFPAEYADWRVSQRVVPPMPVSAKPP